MMVFVVIESIMIAGVTLYQFNKQNSEYHKERLERKEKNLLVDIQYEVKKSLDLSLESLSDSTVIEMADVHNMEFELYNIDGVLIKSSTAVKGIPGKTELDKNILNFFSENASNRYMQEEKNNSFFKPSYNMFILTASTVAVDGFSMIENSSLIGIVVTFLSSNLVTEPDNL